MAHLKAFQFTLNKRNCQNYGHFRNKLKTLYLNKLNKLVINLKIT